MTEQQWQRLRGLIEGFMAGTSASSEVSKDRAFAASTYAGPVPDGCLAFGRQRGVKYSEADTENLDFAFKVLTESLADPAKAKFAEQNRSRLVDVSNELAKRKNGQAPTLAKPPDEINPADFADNITF